MEVLVFDEVSQDITSAEKASFMFQRGDQIAYIPLHAEGDISHPDVEFGFVTSVRGESVWCRFWWKGKPGELRTCANSEMARQSDLIARDSVPKQRVDEALIWIVETGTARFLNVKRDPVKAEWVVIDLDGEHHIAVHPYKDFKRNLDIAIICARALVEAGVMDPAWG